jgi:hypothetical protein
MMPGGHLATSIILSSAVYASTKSAELAVGCFFGGFLIDVDHYLDYIVFEKQWRRPSPANFLRYYFTHQLTRVVLPLHSLELMSALTVLAFFWPQPFLVGYLIGAAMHLVFDVIVNGDHLLKHRLLFYIFIYRAKKGFAAVELLDVAPVDEQESAPFREFFKWLPGHKKTDAEFSESRNRSPK